MKILVTGAKGFLGKNLVAELKKSGVHTVYEYDIDSTPEDLESYCKDCEFVFNLAGVNRPDNVDEYMKGNFGFASELVEKLKQNGNKCPIMVSSSIQAELDNAYGISKKACEDMLMAYGSENAVDVYIYRFPNLFGKWCRPNYNSAVATFCNNIANDLPITVNDRSTLLHLAYVDDVVAELMQALDGQPHVNETGYCFVPCVYDFSLGEIVDLLYSFKESRATGMIPDMSEDSFSKKLYATYISYLPKDKFSYPLFMHEDNRGSFTELLKSVDRGQVSVNVSRPGITKGNHWHNTKNEKFIVVSGKALIRFRKYGEDEVIEYHVSGDKLEVVDIPTGYTHAIVNEGDTDLVTVMWCNECFNPDIPDTIYEEI